MLSKSTTKLVKSCFTSLGLSNAHAHVYMACLEIGTTGGSDIAKRVNLPRSSTYGVLRDLVKLGLVSEIKEATKLQFSPAKPERLYALLHNKQTELQHHEQILNQDISILEELYNSHQSHLPKMRFYNGEDGLRTVLYDSLSSDEIMCICQGSAESQQSLSTDPKYLQDFIQETIVRKIKTKELLEDSPAVREYKALFGLKDHQIYITPRTTKGNFKHVDKFIYQNKISYVSHDNLIGVIIEDETLAKFERSQFDALWSYYS